MSISTGGSPSAAGNPKLTGGLFNASTTGWGRSKGRGLMGVL